MIAVKLQQIITNFKVKPTKVVPIVHDKALNRELSVSILQEHHSTESICFLVTVYNCAFNFCS